MPALPYGIVGLMYVLSSSPFVTGNIIYGLAVESAPESIRYVGQTTNLKSRHHAHVQESRKPKFPVHFWINKHGSDKLLVYILETCESREHLDDSESVWIQKLDTYIKESETGLNCTVGGRGYSSFGYAHADSTREHLSSLNRGELSHTAILTESDVLSIRSLYFHDKVLQSTIADTFGVSRSTIAGIIKRRKWRYLPKSEDELHYTGTISSKALLDAAQVRDVRKRRSQGETVLSIARHYNISRTTIYAIDKGVSYKNV